MHSTQLSNLLKEGDRHLAMRLFREGFEESLGASPLFQQAASAAFRLKSAGAYTAGGMTW